MFHFLFCIIVSIHCVCGQTLTDTKQLYTDVFSNLNKNVIPKPIPSEPLNISVTFFPMTIASFHETEEVIIVLCALGMDWTDGGISWTPASYGNIEQIALPNNNIWRPSISLINSVDTLDPLDADGHFTANIKYDGSVNAVVGGVLQAKCTTDIFKFPYDSQTCTLEFNMFNALASDVTFLVTNASTGAVSTGFYTPNSDWDLKSYSAKAYSLFGYSLYSVTFTIKRQPLYYSLMVVCPTLLFALINPLVFLLPVDSGERIGLSMTVLLSYAIFLTLTSAAVPATSNPMSATLIIMMVVIFISGFIVVATIGISAIYHRDETKKINKFWKFFATRLPWNKQKNVVRPRSEKMCQNDQITVSWNDEPAVSWKEVTYGLDSVCMIVSYSMLFLINLIFWLVVLS